MKPRSEAVSGTEEMTQHGAHRTVEGERRVLGEGSAPDPPAPSHAKGGRTRMDDREAFAAMMWRAGLLEYDELEGIEWEWQAIDGAMTKAPLGRGATGKNPTDRAKMGTKRSMLTDGAGIPLAVVVEGANRHDSKLLVATLEGLMVARPAPGEEEEMAYSSEQHLCLDAAYDSEGVREEIEARNYESHIS